MLQIDEKTILEYEVKAIHKEFNMFDKDDEQEFKVIMDIASNITIWRKESNNYILLNEEERKDFFSRKGSENIFTSRGTLTTEACEAAKRYLKSADCLMNEGL